MEMLYKILLTIIFLTNVTLQFTGKIDENVKYIQELIQIYFENANCLYFIQDNLTYSNSVGKATTNVQIVSVHITKIKFLRRVPFTCGGYLVLSSNKTAITRLFSIDRINTYFKPHNRVVLFTENTTLLNKKEIESATELHNLGLIIVENVNSQRSSNKLIDSGEVLQISWIANTTFVKQFWFPDKVLSKLNRTFCIALFHCPPFVMADKGNESYDGIEIKMLEEILKDWPKRFWHFHKKKDTPGELFALALRTVLHNKCDVAICSQWMQVAYRFQIEKSAGYTFTCRNLLVHRSQLLSDFGFLLQPLEPNLWLIYLITFILSSFMMYTISNILNKARTLKIPRTNIIVILTLTLRIYFLGPIGQIPHMRERSMRLVLLSLFLFCVLISTYYSAGLTLCLRFPRFSKNINSLNDVIENNIKWIDSNKWFRNWMKNTSNELFERLALQFELVTSISQRNEKLRQENYAMVVDTLPDQYEQFFMFAETLDNHGREHLKILQEDIGCFNVLFPLRVNSPYVEMFNKVLVRLVEHGFIDHWHSTFINKSEYRFMKVFFQRYSHQVPQNINLQKLQGAFYSLFLGHSFAFIVFCVECYIKKQR
jgi:hypothetical protein